MKSIQEILVQFREAAIRNSALNPIEANKAYRIGQKCLNALKATDAGRKGLQSLMNDENPYVRLCAAARSLQWDQQTARRVLEQLRDSDGPGAFSAKWTLIEFDKGNL